ncbi:MAG: recombinase family protein [Patescibacteria group bacterium]
MKSISVSRVSTEEQREAGNSLPAQVERIKNYCERKNFSIIKTFSFDESAYKEKRDEFDKLLEYVQDVSKKEKVAVCFDKVDRLSRSVFDQRVSALFGMATFGRIELHFVSDNQVIDDKMSATENFRFSINLGLAKYYSDAIGDSVKRAFEKKRKNGEWFGNAPIGYLNVSLDEVKRLRKDIIFDPEREHLVKMIFELYATGNYSYKTIQKEITNLGLRSKEGKELHRSMIERILRNSFYCGIAYSRKYNETWIHKYPRLINKDLFDKCQDIRLKRRKMPSKETSRDYIFKGLLKCQNCGCSMSPELKVKPNGKEYVYYSCTNAKGICKRKYINEKDLLKPIYKVLDKFGTITEDVQNDLIDELRKNTEAEVEFHKIQVNRLRKEYDEFKDMDSNLIDMFARKSITKDEYDKKHQEYADKLQLLEIELSEHREADYEYQTTVATLISVARRSREIFENCSEPIEKRAFLRMILQNPVVEGKKLEFSMVSPFNLVLELADRPNLLRE